ncbi:MAG: glycoside hydrolase family 65 protein [Crocinitomicaceae bacterium]|nr:glycoside hydrolase family 65 protein [Crocinitomicaceae bacterium]
MHNLFEIDDWKIIENSFDSGKQKQAESIFSIGNGSFGQRANFEEKYSGDSLQGSYVGGVYYPDKTRVGWWKNGYPEYFAKVLNSCNWIGINIEIDGIQLDLNTCEVKSFYRELDMFRGTLTRNFKVKFENGKELEVKSIRFCSMAREEVAAISYTVTPLNFSGNIKFTPYLDGKVHNHDSNYNEFFWEEDSRKVDNKKGVVCAKTKKTNFAVATAMRYSFWREKELLEIHPNIAQHEFYVENNFEHYLEKGVKYTLKKYVAIISTLNHSEFSLIPRAINQVRDAYMAGFDTLLSEHENTWNEIWKNADIQIEGDAAAQQGIRFNIFQLYQTYTGKNAKLNIGPKGFTGEKYGGATYWDTEAYCLPFYLKTAEPSIARQLLVYRYHHLDRAIENAEKLGFKDGAALYPMVTMNGEECHNEWEITFEEIHRNGAIAFGIYNYIRHTGDTDYLYEYGRPVLVAIARFWAQRFNWSESKKAYVMLGVTGPNEYENNVNNNWYTNYLAKWCIQYALEVDTNLRASNGSSLRLNEEDKWQHIINNVYFPTLEGTKVYLQQDGFMDKEQLSASDLPEKERPINQHWSWDRILRSIFIKQADVLQGLYLFEDHFDFETLRENFDFYEPKTVHESSLSPCVHVILAAKIGNMDKAYELYLRTSRLDLDDYNHEADEGLHITSMAGTWMSVVEGMAGVRIHENGLTIDAKIPDAWKSYKFQILYKNNPLAIAVNKETIELENLGYNDLEVQVSGEIIHLNAAEKSVQKLIFQNV